MAMRRVVAGENLITSRGLTFLVAGAKFARPSAEESTVRQPYALARQVDLDLARSDEIHRGGDVAAPHQHFAGFDGLRPQQPHRDDKQQQGRTRDPDPEQRIDATRNGMTDRTHELTIAEHKGRGRQCDKQSQREQGNAGCFPTT